MAGLPSVRAIWDAHHAGLDGMPPLNTILTRLVVGVAGVGPVSVRIPPMLGVWVFALAAFAIVRARANTIAGLIAMLLIGVSDAAGSAWEARGYGLMLGLFALAMLAWTEAASGRHRRLYLPLLSIALAAGVWTHYYAAIGFLPITAGEIVRAVRTRKIDWPIAAALAIAVILILPLSLHLAFAHSQSATYFRKTTTAEIPRTFAGVAHAVLGPWGIGVAALIVALFVFSYSKAQRSEQPPIPPRELAAGAATLLIPLWAMLTGLLVASGAFVPRYAIAAILGYCIVLALLTSRLPSRVAQLVVVGVLLVGSVFEGIDAPRNPAVISPFEYRPHLLNAAFSPRPIVITGTLYLQIWYYAPQSIRAQLRYVADPAAALRLIGTDSLEHDYLVLKNWSEVSVETYDAFVKDNSQFFLYDAESLGGWLLQRLREDRAEIAPVGQEFGATLYSVKLRG